MNWRECESLKTLRDQVNGLFPNRDRSSDGTIGDLAHSERKSDHNPNAAGVVTAWDCDADLSPTQNVGILVAALQASKDPRIKYLIWNRQITVKGNIQQWKPYHGVNAHQHHCHISVSSDPKLYDDPRRWDLRFGVIEIKPVPGRDLRVGMTGDDVKALQTALKITADGKFGPKTEASVKGFQLSNGLRADGIVGPNTKAALGI